MRILDLSTRHDGWNKLHVATVEMPNGAVEERVIEDHGESAAVLLYDPERRITLMVEQPRAPVLYTTGEAMFQEIPAGRVQDGDTPDQTARKESLEEAGVRVRDLEHVTSLRMIPSISTELIHLYLAAFADADRVSAGGGATDENECIKVREMPLVDLWHMAEDGRLQDAKAIVLLHALRNKMPDLF